MQKYEVKIEDTGETFLCSEDIAVLIGMARMGKKGIPSGCHGGGCGVCKIRIESGEVKKKVMSRAHISEEEEKQGIVLACRVFPRSDLSIKVIGKLQKNVVRSAPVKKYGFV